MKDRIKQANQIITDYLCDRTCKCLSYTDADKVLSALTPPPKIDGLEIAIRNVGNPCLDGKCREWYLWCGEKQHAEAILKAARSYMELSEGENND